MTIELFPSLWSKAEQAVTPGSVTQEAKTRLKKNCSSPKTAQDVVQSFLYLTNCVKMEKVSSCKIKKHKKKLFISRSNAGLRECRPLVVVLWLYSMACFWEDPSVLFISLLLVSFFVSSVTIVLLVMASCQIT